MTNPLDIEKLFTIEIKSISDMIDQAPFENRQFCFEWMSQQFYLVQNSTRYLAFAASRVDVSDSKSFRDWTHHLAEELDHDKTLVKDIHSLGFTQFAPMASETKALINLVYQEVDRRGPDTLLGYSLLLEGLSCVQCVKVGKRLEKAFQFKSAYLHLHGKVDENHYPDGMERLKQFSVERQHVVADNLVMVASLYRWLLTQVQIRATKAQEQDSLSKVG